MNDITAQASSVAKRGLSDGRGNDLVVASEEQLVRRLADIDAEARRGGRPLIAILCADIDDKATPTLSIGLGADKSLLVHRGEGDESVFSHGADGSGDAEVTYDYGTVANTYLGWMLIPKEAAVSAATEFYRTGARPTNVAWREL